MRLQSSNHEHRRQIGSCEPGTFMTPQGWVHYPPSSHSLACLAHSVFRHRRIHVHALVRWENRVNNNEVTYCSSVAANFTFIGCNHSTIHLKAWRCFIYRRFYGVLPALSVSHILEHTALFCRDQFIFPFCAEI